MFGVGPRSLAVCILLVATWTTAASAQTDEELDQARATFGEGVAATQDERWDDAVAAFRAVIAVRDTSAVKYNLAFALAHTDAIGEAADLLEAVLADPELDDGTRANAIDVLDTLEPRLAHLTIRLSGDEAGMTILLDGEEVELGDIGRPIRIAPGVHEVVLRRGETDLATRHLTIEEGGREEVMLTPSAVPDVVLGPDRGGGGGDITSEWWFWTIIGAGVVAIGVGIIIGVAVSSDGVVQPVLGNLDPAVLRVMP